MKINENSAVSRKETEEESSFLDSEFEDIFVDCEMIPNDEFTSDEPKIRQELPYLKDPKMKVSFWTIIKDNLGKDLTRMSVPVYFNDPCNIL